MVIKSAAPITESQRREFEKIKRAVKNAPKKKKKASDKFIGKPGDFQKVSS